MSAENSTAITKEAALAQLEKALKEDDSENLDFLNSSYELVRKLGASDYEVKRVEFLVEPPETRQRLLNLEARGDLIYRVYSLPGGAELLQMYEKIRAEFGLKDPYIG